MFKTMLATFVVKTGIGFYFIQEIKNMHRSLGVKVSDDFQKDLLTAAILPNWIFLVATILALMIVLALKSLFKDFYQKTN